MEPLATASSEDALHEARGSWNDVEASGNPTNDSEPSSPLVSITGPFSLNRICQPWCSCACHIRRLHKFPAALKFITGSFLIGYSGLPVLTPACDQENCRKRSTISVAATYQFPAWLLSRIICAKFTTSSLQGACLSVSMPRMITWNSPLWIAAREGNQARIEMLFSNGLASPFDVNAYGESALHYTARFKHVRISKFLIEQGADLDLENKDGRKPIDTAWELILSGSMSSSEEAAIAAQTFDHEDYLTTRQFTSLHRCILGLSLSSSMSPFSSTTLPPAASDQTRSSCPSSLDLLLSNCPHQLINQLDAYHRTPLSWAASRRDHEAMKLLLAHGADPSIPDLDGNTPLFHAVKASDIAGTKILLSSFPSSSPNKKGNSPQLAKALDSAGATVLHITCFDNDNPEMINLLVSTGEIDIDARDSDGDTALNYCIWGGFFNSFETLLKLGANPTVRNTSGDNVLNMAIYYGREEMVRLLLSWGGEKGTLLFHALLGNVTHQGETILHSVCGMADLAIMSIFSGEKDKEEGFVLLKDEDLAIIDGGQKTVDGLTYAQVFANTMRSRTDNTGGSGGDKEDIEKDTERDELAVAFRKLDERVRRLRGL